MGVTRSSSPARNSTYGLLSEQMQRVPSACDVHVTEHRVQSTVVRDDVKTKNSIT